MPQAVPGGAPLPDALQPHGGRVLPGASATKLEHD